MGQGMEVTVGVREMCPRKQTKRKEEIVVLSSKSRVIQLLTGHTDLELWGGLSMELSRQLEVDICPGAELHFD
jgi:hypothetical protein